MQDERSPSGTHKETVLLLHGLHGTPLSMRPLATALRRSGFDTHAPFYRSRAVALERLVDVWLPQHVPMTAQRFHLVAYSMGALIVRLWLQRHGMPARLGRVVMIAPPNAGSEIVDALDRLGGARLATGRNGARLGTAVDALPALLGPWPEAAPPLGIIAGAHAWSTRLLPLVAAPHDGRVSVAATHLPGAHAHLVLQASHRGILRQAATAQHVVAFLRSGAFAPHEAVSAAPSASCR